MRRWIVGRRLHRKLEQRAVGFDDGVNLADVDEALAVGARHLPVHLDDEMARAEARGHAAVDGRAEAEKPVVVRRAGLQERYVDRNLAAGEQLFDLAEENRRVVGASGLHCLADVPAEEQAVVAEDALILGPGVGRLSERQHVADFNVAEGGSTLDERIHERFGGAAAFVDIDAIARADYAYGVGGRHPLCAVFLEPDHRVAAPFAGAQDSTTTAWVTRPQCTSFPSADTSILEPYILIVCRPLPACLGGPDPGAGRLWFRLACCSRRRA